MIGYRELLEDFKQVFAIGDVHGCPAELATLLEHLQKNENLSATEDLVVFIGDYIDRGPDSKGAVDILSNFKKAFPATVLLCGNHEEMMFRWLNEPSSAEQHANWVANGGAQTLLSYGLPADLDAITLAEKFQTALPDSHKQFLGSLERYVVHGDYCFAHAGVNPLRDLRAQVEQDLFWIRQEFISNIHYFRKTVVFGHTPFEDVLFHLPYKIGIDTGLVFGNKLSCLELNSKRIIQVPRDSKQISIRSFPIPNAGSAGA